jgi:hypothetical protein
MLQILEFTKNNLIATKAQENLTEADIQKIHPLIHTIVNRGQKVCFTSRTTNRNLLLDRNVP